MKKIFMTGLTTGLMMFGMAGAASATLVTSLPGGTISPIPVKETFGGASQTIGSGITWSSTSESAMTGIIDYGFGTNGRWNSLAANSLAMNSLAMAGINDKGTTATMTFEFSSPVKGIGGLLNYSPGNGSPVISVYDSDFVLIEFAKLIFDTGGASNSGMFYGFLEESNLI